MAKSLWHRMLLLIAVLSLGVAAATPPEAQESERKAKATAAQKKQQKAQRASKGATPGYPSCEAGVLWVDSLCRRRDGRICQVDEYDLINCQ